MENNGNNDRLRQCFQKVGSRYGFDTINAEFMAFRDFKVRWQRSYRWADFRVSDYIDDAPDDVLESLAESLFQRIQGRSDEYSEKLRRWVTAPGFSTTKQSTYLERSVNLSKSVYGVSKNLQESYDRLIGAGLVEYDPELVLSWTKENCIPKVGHCSVLMKVVSISRALDSDKVPDFVLDYCLYHELCHVMMGFDPTGDAHSDEFFGLECRFPERNEAEHWLRKTSVYV